MKEWALEQVFTFISLACNGGRVTKYFCQACKEEAKLCQLWHATQAQKMSNMYKVFLLSGCDRHHFRGLQKCQEVLSEVHHWTHKPWLCLTLNTQTLALPDIEHTFPGFAWHFFSVCTVPDTRNKRSEVTSHPVIGGFRSCLTNGSPCWIKFYRITPIILLAWKSSWPITCLAWAEVLLLAEILTLRGLETLCDRRHFPHTNHLGLLWKSYAWAIEGLVRPLVPATSMNERWSEWACLAKKWT